MKLGPRAAFGSRPCGHGLYIIILYLPIEVVKGYSVAACEAKQRVHDEVCGRGWLSAAGRAVMDGRLAG